MDILFNASERSTLGVEVELQIVDRRSRELRSGASEMLRRLEKERGEPHPKAKNELIESNIELVTGICSTVAEARVDLEATLTRPMQKKFCMSMPSTFFDRTMPP